MVSEEIAGSIAFVGRVIGPIMLKRPDSPEVSAIIDELGKLDSLSEWPFGSEDELLDAYALVREGLSEENRASLRREHARLFVGPEAFRAPSWGSVYLDPECVVFGNSTLELRRWLRMHRVTVEYTEREPEDQIGRMLLLMAHVAENQPDDLPELLSDHILTWSPRYFELLDEDVRHPFYKGIGRLANASLEAIRAELDLDVPHRKVYR